MAESMFTMDGVSYDVRIPAEGIKRSGSILDGPTAGRLQSGSMVLDTIGAYFNYTIGPIKPNPANVASYDALYLAAMSVAKREHTVVMPFGQSTISFKAYVSNAEDVLKKRRNGVNYWSGLELYVVMVDPYWTP